MRAMRAEEFSGYEGLKLVDLPRPTSHSDDFIRFHLRIRAIVDCLRRGRGLAANPWHGRHRWHVGRHHDCDINNPGDFLSGGKVHDEVQQSTPN